MSILTIERGPDKGKRIKLSEFPVTIGRDEENTITIRDDEVSRFHLKIKARGNTLVVQDLDSKNGTYINGDKAMNAILSNGDLILVGGTELSFVGAESRIKLAGSIDKFDMVLSDEATGSIRLDAGKELHKLFDPRRLDPTPPASEFLARPDTIGSIYSYHSHVMVVSELKEAANLLLKYVGKILPQSSRACFFLYKKSSKELHPLSEKQFKISQPFLLSQRSFEDVLNRSQGVLLQAKSNQATHSHRSRLLLPMIHNGEILGIIHIEDDDPRSQFDDNAIYTLQALMNRCASVFESMILRREMDSWMVGMIETMINTVEAKDTYTRGHSERVSRYAMAIADELKLNREVKRLLLISSLCHDIGKIGIPDNILKKANILSAEEYEEMKQHPTIGAEIIKHMPDAHRFFSGLKYHHERWDGTGYPEGLAGEKIPFFGRIIGICDSFDAMVSGRSYSGFMDETEAVERLGNEKDIFDPEILKTFIRAYENGTLTLKTSTKSRDPDQDEEALRKESLRKVD
jgi:HD-GYP domain-containing protein (c-di-GMP phosphodiesterase class II)